LICLLDTNVISEWTKPRPDPGVVAWLKAADESSLYLSVVAFAEIRLGIELLPKGRKRDQLTRWLETDLVHRFEGRHRDRSADRRCLG
jgi:toxin FitB